MKSRLQKYFIKFLVRHLFNTITAEQLLNIDDHQVFLKGVSLNREQIAELSKRATALEHDDFLKVLFSDAKYLAGQTMFIKSSTPEDIMFGKAILYVVVELFENRIKQLAK